MEVFKKSAAPAGSGNRVCQSFLRLFALWRFHDHALADDIIDRLAVHQRANHPEFQIVVFRFGRTKIRCGNRASSLNIQGCEARAMEVVLPELAASFGPSSADQVFAAFIIAHIELPRCELKPIGRVRTASSIEDNPLRTGSPVIPQAGGWFEAHELRKKNEAVQPRRPLFTDGAGAGRPRQPERIVMEVRDRSVLIENYQIPNGWN